MPTMTGVALYIVAFLIAADRPSSVIASGCEQVVQNHEIGSDQHDRFHPRDKVDPRIITCFANRLKCPDC